MSRVTHFLGDDCHTGHEQDAEIARLRAEVERLESSHAEAVLQELEHERDEALEQVAILREALAAWKEGR